MKRYFLTLCLALSALLAPARAEGFFDSLDLPTVFGVGVVPDKPYTFAYYSSMFIEYRAHKTYDWYALIGMDTHNHAYIDSKIPGSNVTSDERFGMDILVGAGYRIPLVKDIRSFYEHPTYNPWNFGIGAQIGPSFTYVKNVEPTAVPDQYVLSNKWFYFPVVKINAAVEYFIAPKFCIFAQISYLQQFQKMPWDNGVASGVLIPAVGFASFFE